MKLSDFDFNLPPELIAQQPVEPRDHSKLLHIPQSGPFADYSFYNLPSLLKKGDLLVFNNTKVIPARLLGTRGEATVEVTLHRNLGTNDWEAFVKRSKRLKSGDHIHFAEDFHAEVIKKLDGGKVHLRFCECDNIFLKLEQYGQMPLPPYIKRAEKQSSDNQSYQTVYAQKEGAVAAPTAGLHFTQEVLNSLEQMGVEKTFITLHVGGGTFLPVKTENISEHVMHSEWIDISTKAAAAINRAKDEDRRVIAVGTTSLRSLEAAAMNNSDDRVSPMKGDTDIFITPGYRFRTVDALITNFHLPKSTLFMLVSAFCGLERMQNAYQHAIDRSYRFFSYGDSSFLERAEL